MGFQEIQFTFNGDKHDEKSFSFSLLRHGIFNVCGVAHFSFQSDVAFVTTLSLSENTPFQAATSYYKQVSDTS